MANVFEAFMQRDRDWWLKVGHAADHVQRLDDAVRDYRSRNPLSVDPDRQPDGSVEFTFRQSEPIPNDLSLILGDAVHCMRSALDSLVYALVQTDLGRRLTEKEEKATQFPISEDPDKFALFIQNNRLVMSDRMAWAVRGSQPFYWLEQAIALDVDTQGLTFKEDSRWHPLTAIRDLSNLDKHRRLAVTAWWPSLVHWGSDGPTDWAWHGQAAPPWTDGTVVGILSGGRGEPPDVVHEVNIVTTDIPGANLERLSSENLPALARRWVQTTGFTLGSVIQAYDRWTPESHEPSA